MDKIIQIREEFKPVGKIKTVQASILNPEYAGMRFILNFNDLGGKYTSPLYSIFDKKWRQVLKEVKGWYSSKLDFRPGSVLTTAVQSDTWIVNMLCQKETALDGKALDVCLDKVAKLAKEEKASVHLSNMLIDLSPKAILDSVFLKLCKAGIHVVIYEEPGYTPKPLVSEEVMVKATKPLKPKKVKSEAKTEIKEEVKVEEKVEIKPKKSPFRRVKN